MNTRADDLETRLRDALEQRADATTVHEREWADPEPLGGVVDLDVHRSRRRVVWGSVVAAAALVALVIGAVAVIDRGDTEMHTVTAGRVPVESDGVVAFEPTYVPDGYRRVEAPDALGPDDTCTEWRYRDGTVRCPQVVGARAFSYSTNGKASDDNLSVVTVPGTEIQRGLIAGEKMRTVDVRGHRATLLEATEDQGARLFWEEPAGTTVFVIVPKGIDVERALRVARSVRERHLPVRTQVSLSVANASVPELLQPLYGPSLRLAVRFDGTCLSYLESMPCAPLRGDGPVRLLGPGALDGAVVAASLAPEVHRLAVLDAGGRSMDLAIERPEAPLDGRRFVFHVLDGGTLPVALVAYDGDGKELVRLPWKYTTRNGYRELASGVTDGLAWRVSYHAGPSSFCVKIDSVIGTDTGDCSGGPVSTVGDGFTTDAYFVWGTQRGRSLSRVTVGGADGRVFAQPGWPFRVWFAVRTKESAGRVVGYDAAGHVVMRRALDCGEASSCQSAVAGSLRSYESSSGSSGESSGASATTAPASATSSP